LEKLINGILDSYPALQEEGTTIQLEGSFPNVTGNEAFLTQVFSNLLSNAVKFVAPGTKPVVRVWAETRADRVRIFVQDNGIGIPPEQQKKLFAIFQRVSKTYDGTGIGLAIVKKAAERMGGQVGLESRLGQGSTFWIELQNADQESK
jgi:signal transduction histidine kinase